MAAVFFMAEGRYDIALPYLRNAEFLDARWQKMPFGTDAPLVYALMYRCLLLSNGDSSQITYAQNGLFRSVRFLNMQKPLIDALVEMAKTDIRATAITNRMAYLIFEVSIYHSLMTAANNLSVRELIDDAIKKAQLFTSAWIKISKMNISRAYCRPLKNSLMSMLKV